MTLRHICKLEPRIAQILDALPPVVPGSEKYRVYEAVKRELADLSIFCHIIPGFDAHIAWLYTVDEVARRLGM